MICVHKLSHSLIIAQIVTFYIKITLKHGFIPTEMCVKSQISCYHPLSAQTGHLSLGSRHCLGLILGNLVHGEIFSQD